MSTSLRITPFLWYDDKAEEAANLYVSLFPNSQILSVEQIASGPAVSGAIVEFELDGLRVTAFDGGPVFTFSHAVSFSIACDTQEEIDHYWHGLSEGGLLEQCGWLQDRYGLSWQVVPAALSEIMQQAPQAVMSALLQMEKIDIDTLRCAAASA